MRKEPKESLWAPRASIRHLHCRCLLNLKWAYTLSHKFKMSMKAKTAIITKRKTSSYICTNRMENLTATWGIYRRRATASTWMSIKIKICYNRISHIPTHNSILTTTSKVSTVVLKLNQDSKISTVECLKDTTVQLECADWRMTQLTLNHKWSRGPITSSWITPTAIIIVSLPISSAANKIQLHREILPIISKKVAMAMEIAKISQVTKENKSFMINNTHKQTTKTSTRKMPDTPHTSTTVEM